MANKPNFPRNNQRGGPPIKPMRIDLATLDSFHCPKCSNSAFNPVVQMLEVPALVAMQPDGKPGLIRVELMLCVTCGGVWRLEQLKKLTAVERESLRAVEELKRQMKEGGAN